MPTKVVFSSKQAEENFWASHASQGTNNSGNHPVSQAEEVESRRTKSKTGKTYPTQSLFSKFNHHNRTPYPLRTKKQSLWARCFRHRVAKVHPRLDDCSIVDELHRQQHSTTIDVGDAKYSPWSSAPVVAIDQTLYENRFWYHRPERRYRRGAGKKQREIMC